MVYADEDDKNDHKVIDFPYLVRVTFGMRCGDSTKDLVRCATERGYGAGKVEFYKVGDRFEEVKV